METPPPSQLDRPGLGKIPVVVAVLALFYATVATVSAAALWKTAQGAWQFPVGWAAMGLVLGSLDAVGLALLKAWARRLARATSACLAGFSLWMATAYVAAGQPFLGVAASFFGGLAMAAYYYLRRPLIKAFFV